MRVPDRFGFYLDLIRQISARFNLLKYSVFDQLPICDWDGYRKLSLAYSLLRSSQATPK